VRRAHVGSSDAVVGPPIAELGQVGEDDSDSRFSCISAHRARGGSDGVDVLEDDEPGTKRAKGCGNREPDLPVLAVDAGAASREGVVGAGESGGDDVDTLYHAPVGLEEVAVVGDARPAGGEDLRGGGVLLAVPEPLDPERPLEAEVEAAGAGAERSASERTHAASACAQRRRR
jgi:hypothetical protein